MDALLQSRPELQDELKRLMAEESKIDAELSQYFGMIAGPKPKSGGKSNLSFASLDLASSVEKLEQVGPTFEAMQQDSKKLLSQVEDCQALSERLSKMVRRLDTMQIRAQQTLACTEDIINLKDCKTKIISAIEERNLTAAVSFLRQVHEIDVIAAQSSDDYEIIKEKEKVIKTMVQQEFAGAISSSNIKSVMALCPLLQTLGLESEARDTFLDFVEASVFTAVSADASSVEGSTDAATAYAKSLSNVFNSAYVIMQQYLPMVIQGMENSLGDVHFIRRLHKRCEQESGMVLKRYMKFRRIRDVMGAIKSSNAGSSSVKLLATPAEMHTIMDELALMIQYCCRYAKYIKHVCKGAEGKKRNRIPEPRASVPVSAAEQTPASTATTDPVIVFAGPSEFDKMVDELLNKYYMEGEQWLMRLGVQSALPRVIPTAGLQSDDMQLDECFFLLQKCGMRAVATNNIHAACAVLHLIADLISTDLLSQANGMVTHAIGQVGLVMIDHINKFKRGIASAGEEGGSNTAGNSGFNALSLASTFTGSMEGSQDGSSVGGGGGIRLQEEGGFSLTGNPNSTPADPWGVASTIEVFNILELCVRYTERLSKDINSAAVMVFVNHDQSEEGADSNNHSSSSSSNNAAATLGGTDGKAKPSVVVAAQASEMDKIKLCRENFEAAKMSFSNALRQSAEKLVQSAQGMMKDIFQATIGRSGPMGGIRFDEQDASFDAQPALNLLPRILCLPVETIVNICTFNLSERNKDMIVGMLADACCERLEHFITQTTFRFAGALKLEEIVRSLSSLFSRFSTIPVRGRFSRLREVMLVLTSDVATPVGLISDNFTQLTNGEVETFLMLRIDAQQQQQQKLQQKKPPQHQLAAAASSMTR